MKLFINLTSIFKGGAEQVAASFVEECKKFPQNEYHVFLRNNIVKLIEKESFPKNFFFLEFKARPGKSFGAFRSVIKALNQKESELNPDCVVSTGGHGYWRPKAPLIAGFNIPHFVYPESPYFNQMNLKGKVIWWLKEKIHMRFYSRTDALIVQTADVKTRLEAKLNNTVPVHVIPNTVNGHFLDPKSVAYKLPPREANEIRLLMLSSYYPHKNHKIIVDTVKELNKKAPSRQFKFVVTLRSDHYERLFSGVSHCVINVGPIPIAECPALYEECDFMFLPTLLECFSASYIEAMLMRKPILTSDLGFARTVCKDAAVYFDPVDPVDTASKIIALAEGIKKQNALTEKGTQLAEEIGTPQKRAEAILELCHKVINQKKEL